MPLYLATIESWQRVVLLYAAVMGIEAGILFWLTYTRRRPWYEEALAGVPLAIVIWALVVVRSLQQTLADLRAYEKLHPGDVVAPAAFVDTAARAGWAVVGVSTAMLVAGILLVLSWQRSRTRPARAGRGPKGGRLVHARPPRRAGPGGNAKRPLRHDQDDLEQAFRDWR